MMQDSRRHGRFQFQMGSKEVSGFQRPSAPRYSKHLDSIAFAPLDSAGITTCLQRPLHNRAYVLLHTVISKR